MTTNLYSAGNYAIIANKINNIGGTSNPSYAFGNVALTSTGTFPAGLNVNGREEIDNATATQAFDDATTAITTLINSSGTPTSINEELGGQILTAGNYTSNSGSPATFTLSSGTLTLNGSNTDIFIFQASFFYVDPGTSITLNGVDQANVIWYLNGTRTPTLILPGTFNFPGIVYTTGDIDAGKVFNSPVITSGTINLSDTYAVSFAPVYLSTARNFAILGNGTVTDNGIPASSYSTIYGNIGANTTNIDPTKDTVVGSIYTSTSSPAIWEQAITDSTVAYNYITNHLPFTTLSNATLDNQTLNPGFYSTTSAITLSSSTNVTFNLNQDDAFIFYSNGLTIGDNATISINSIGSFYFTTNIFWFVNGDVTIGEEINFYGSIISNGSITIGDGSNIFGSIISISTTSDNTITIDENGRNGCTLYSYYPVPYTGTTSMFAVLSSNSVSNTGTTILYGDLGADTTADITGDPITVYGSTYTSDNSTGTVYSTAINDANNLYNVLFNLPPITVPNSNFGGPNTTNNGIAPGFYFISQFNGPVTLIGDPNYPDDLFVFFIVTSATATFTGTLTLSNVSTNNIYWFTLNDNEITISPTDNNFYGTFITDISVILSSGVIAHNSILAPPSTSNPIIMLNNNTIYSDNSCLHADTLIATNRGVLPIYEIRSGDTVYSVDGKPIHVLYNIKLKSIKNYTCIRKDTFASDCPSRDIYITNSHPILVNGQYTYPYKFYSSENTNISPVVLDYAIPMYSLCTVEQEFMNVHNLPVSTWRESDFLSEANRAKFHWEKL